MSINCSKNPKLELLEKKQAELDALMSNLASQGAAAMSALKAKLDEVATALTDMIPELPEIPNFQKELQELAGKVGEDLAKAKAAFKERWGDALPDVDIDGLMSKVAAAGDALGNIASGVEDAVSEIAGAAGDALSGIASGVADAFDFCKDVPNIDAPEVVDGKVTKVIDKGPEPTTPAEIPAVVEPVTPTIVAKEEQPSVSSVTEKPLKEIANAYVPFENEIKEYIKPYTAKKMEYYYARKATGVEDSKEWKKLIDDKIAAENASFDAGEGAVSFPLFYNYYATESQKELIQTYYTAGIGHGEAKKAAAALLLVKKLLRFYRERMDENSPNGITDPQEFFYYKINYQSELFEHGKFRLERKKFDDTQVFADVKAIWEKHKEAVLEYRAYLDARAAGG